MSGMLARIRKTNMDTLSNNVSSLDANGPTQELEFMLDVTRVITPLLHFSIKSSRHTTVIPKLTSTSAKWITDFLIAQISQLMKIK